MTQIFSKKASLWFRGLAIIIVILSHYAEWWAWFTPTEGSAELWRQAFSRLGPYGVAIFFLFSGYGLVSSIGNGPMTFAFIRKRFLASYLPYLIVVGIIEALSGGFTDLHDFAEFLYGHDYWFMVVLFLFYIGFICIWSIPVNRHIHAFLFTVFTWAMSTVMYQNGEHSFWYISNPAFALGVLLALYEPFCKKVLNASRTPMLVLLTAGMAVCVYFGIFSVTPAQWTPEETINAELLATFVWTLLIAYLASDLHGFDPVIPLFGKYSLYLYLTHQFIFLRVINNMTDSSFSARFCVAAAATIVISLLSGMAISTLTGQINRLFTHNKNA